MNYIWRGVKGVVDLWHGRVEESDENNAEARGQPEDKDMKMVETVKLKFYYPIKRRSN